MIKGVVVIAIGMVAVTFAIMMKVDWLHIASKGYAGTQRFWHGEYRAFGGKEPTSFEDFQTMCFTTNGLGGVIFIALGIWSLLS